MRCRSRQALAAAALAACLGACAGGGWRAGVPRHTHAAGEHFHNHVPTTLLPAEALPAAWDWCGASGGHHCVASWNQHIPVYCGSCWVHGALSMIQDRLKIKKNGTGPDVMLGRQTLLNCAAYEGMGAGCDGGDVIDVMHYMTKHGLPDESCMPYAATDHTAFPAGLAHCPHSARCRNCMPLGKKEVETCWAVRTPLLYYLRSFGRVTDAAVTDAAVVTDAATAKPDPEQQERLMMSEILTRGPITCSIATPDDFTYGYRSGVWADKSNSTAKDVDHDIEVVGWGEQDGLKFWQVRNSWGTFWGELSFFKVQRGVNALLIENGDCWYADPTFAMESEDRAHKLVGSMWGVLDANATEQQQQQQPPADLQPAQALLAA